MYTNPETPCRINRSLHSETEIVEAFKEYDARIVFGAETTCWPDRDLAEEYPKPANGGNFRWAKIRTR